MRFDKYYLNIEHTCNSVGLKLGRAGKVSGPFWIRLGVSVQCGFKDGLGGVQPFDQKWELVPKDGTLTDSSTVIAAVIGLDEDDDVDNDTEDDNDDDNDDEDCSGFCFVTNAGSVVTCQWEVCGIAALEWKKHFKLDPISLVLSFSFSMIIMMTWELFRDIVKNWKKKKKMKLLKTNRLPGRRMSHMCRLGSCRFRR